MTKIYTCLICSSEFKNSQSLHSHKSKYHPNRSKTGNSNLKQDMGKDINDSSNKNVSHSRSKSIKPYIQRLPTLFRITTDLLDDIKYLKTAASVTQKQHIPSDKKLDNMMKYIERLPKLFRITGSVMNDVKDLQKDVSMLQTQDFSSSSQMAGSGQGNSKKIIELTDDVDDLFLNINELESLIQKKSGGIEYLEKVFDNTLQISELFKNKMYSELKYKIKELRNAAMLALKFLKRARQLGKDDENLLHKLVNSSIFEGKDLLNNNMESLHAIFSNLPNEEDLIYTIKEIKDSESRGYDDSTDEVDDESDNEEREATIAQSNDDKKSNMSENEKLVEGSVINNDTDLDNDEKELLIDQQSIMSGNEESIDMNEEVKTENEEELVDTEGHDKEIMEVLRA